MTATAQIQADPTPKHSVTSDGSNLLQRKCTCGGTPGPSGECAECRRKRLALQRRATDRAKPSSVPPVVHEVLRSSGQPLDPTTRAFMEPRFGHDFSRVQVHADAKAAESARAVNALAYTVGRDVVFAAGQYAPGIVAGQRLLAHELTHVVQQDRVAASGDAQPVIVREQDASEAEAQQAARDVEALDPLRGSSSIDQPSITVRRAVSSAPRLQRQFVTPLGPGGGYGGLIERDRRRTFQGRTPEETERDKALALAQSLEIQYPGWRSVLPACPCTVGEARGSSDWQEDSFLIRLLILPVFHPGAATAFRSARGYASKPGTSHGQQCTYDELGHLITEGPAAGTPDLWSAVTHNEEHQEVDVAPFYGLGWQLYNQYWIPDNRNSCPINKGEKRKARCEPEYLGFGEYLGEDCIIRSGPGPKF